MENKTAKILLSLALGTVVVWIVFKTKEALAAPEKAITVAPVTVTLPKEPEWYTTARQAVDIFKQIGGLFKREDQVLKEAKEAEIAKSLGLY